MMLIKKFCILKFWSLACFIDDVVKPRRQDETLRTEAYQRPDTEIYQVRVYENSMTNLFPSH